MVLNREKGKYVLPTFVIPGANKSGTSYVAKMLGQHKDIFMSYSKEPSFFSTHKKFGQYHRGPKFYQKNFSGYRGEREIGEASTVYMYDPKSPELLKRHLGQIRLIFILRDPIERVYSNYWQSVKGGLKLPRFENFIRTGNPHAKELIYVSRYDLHLKRYFEYFPEKRVLILFFDDLVSDPRKFFSAITKFLDLPSIPGTIDYSVRVNPSSIPRSKVIARLLKYRPAIQAVKEAVPDKWGPALRRYLEGMRSRIQVPFDYPEMDETSRAFLTEQLFGTIERLETMLAIDLSRWKKKYLGT